MNNSCSDHTGAKAYNKPHPPATHYSSISGSLATGTTPVTPSLKPRNGALPADADRLTELGRATPAPRKLGTALAFLRTLHTVPKHFKRLLNTTTRPAKPLTVHVNTVRVAVHRVSRDHDPFDTLDAWPGCVDRRHPVLDDLRMIVGCSLHERHDSNSRHQLAVEACPDSGAAMSVISRDITNALNAPVTEPAAQINLTAADESSMTADGIAQLRVFTNNKTFDIDCVVTPAMSSRLLIGRPDLQKMRMLPPGFPGIMPDDVWATLAHTKHNVAVNAIATEPAAPAPTATTPAATTTTDHNHLRDILIRDFPDVVSDDLLHDGMQGPPLDVVFRPDIHVNPIRVTTTKQCPIHLQKPAHKLLDELVAKGFIVEVPPNDHSEWCFSAFFLPKPNRPDDARLVCDFSRLKALTLRPVHTFLSATQIIREIQKDSKVFCTMDLLHGYHQCRLTEAAQKVCTFLTFRGRYRYKVSPMGFPSSSDHFVRLTDKALEQAQVNGAVKLVDDVLISAPDLPTLEFRIRRVLTAFRDNNIVVSKKKLHIAAEVKFAGVILSANSITPDPERIRALTDLAPPTTLKELRGWIGAVNQIGLFNPDLSKYLKENLQLLKGSAAFVWTKEHQDAFDLTKDLLRSHLEINFYDPARHTFLLSDGSRTGFGMAVVQPTTDIKQYSATAKYNLITCASRSLVPCEGRYSVSELELAALVWAVRKADFYVVNNQNLTLVTDHKALTTTLKQPLEEIPTERLLRLRLKLSHLTYSVEYTKGQSFFLPDTLSRYPVPAQEADHISVNALEASLTPRPDIGVGADPALHELIEAARADKNYQTLKQAVITGRGVDESDDYTKLFKATYHDLAVLDDLITFQERIVIPPSYVPTLVDKLHLGHHGRDKSVHNAKERYFWPTLKADVTSVTQSCKECIRMLPSLEREPLLALTADEPFECLGADVLDVYSTKYHVVVDYASFYIWVNQLRKETSASLIETLERIFYDFSFRPQILALDNATAYKSGEFLDFLKQWNITPRYSSPYHKQTHGKAEAAVKVIRALLEKNGGRMSKKFRDDLNAHRTYSDPTTGLSPACILFNIRAPHKDLPSLPSFHTTVDRATAFEAKKEATKVKQQIWNKRAQEHSLLRPNQRVFAQEMKLGRDHNRWVHPGRIVHRRDDGRSYLVAFDAGGQAVRNRRHLRPAANDGIEKTVTFQEPIATAIPETDTAAPLT